MSYECYMNVTFRFCFRSPLKSLKLPVFKGLSTDLGSHSFLHISFYPLYFLGRFFSHADFADDADFFIHRMTRNLFGGIPAEAINHGFSQRRSIRSVQIPPEVGKSPTKKNLCISVKSVGRNNPHKEKSASSAKSA